MFAKPARYIGDVDDGAQTELADHQRASAPASQQGGSRERRGDEPRDDARADQGERALVAVGDDDEHGPARLHDEPAEAEHRAEQHHQQRGVAEQGAEQLPEGQPLARRGALPLADAEERQQIEAHPDDRDQGDRPRPAGGGRLVGEAQQTGELGEPEGGEAERDRAERAHQRDHPIAPAGFGERRSDEAPERHVAERVREAPDEEDDAEEHQLRGLIGVGHGEQQRGESPRPVRPRTARTAAASPSACGSCR